MLILLYLLGSVQGFEYLSAVVHSQDVSSMPLRELWHPHLYLARDSSGDHYEIRHSSQYYDVSISFMQVAEDTPGVMNCECRFVMDQIEQNDAEPTFLQVMTTPTKNRAKAPAREKEIAIGTYMPAKEVSREPVHKKKEHTETIRTEEKHTGRVSSEADIEIEKSDRRYVEVEKDNSGYYEYSQERPKHRYTETEEQEEPRRRIVEAEDNNEVPRRRYIESEVNEEYIEEAPIRYYEDEYVMEDSRGQKYVMPRKAETVKYVEYEEGYEDKPRRAKHDPEIYSESYSRYEVPEDVYEPREYSERKKHYDPYSESDRQYSDAYYGRSYNSPVHQDYGKTYKDPYATKVVYVYPYEEAY